MRYQCGDSYSQSGTLYKARPKDSHVTDMPFFTSELGSSVPTLEECFRKIQFGIQINVSQQSLPVLIRYLFQRPARRY